jgi:post-segregation antitoxin (ccd killing protein)
MTLAHTASRISWYARCVSGTTRITVTLPSEQVAALKEITDNVSGYVAEAVARQIRHRLLVDELERHQSEFGAFTQEELAQARAKLFGAPEAATGPAA